MLKQITRRLFTGLMLFATLHNAYAEDWFSHYYEQPTPERFVAEVQALSKAGVLANPKTNGAITVFLGRVMAANPAQVSGWLDQLSDLQGTDREILLLAANLSATPAAQAFLARQADAQKYRGKPSDIRALEPDNPTVLDMLWADFFATGEAAPIRRIVRALDYGKYTGALERYATSAKTKKETEEARLGAVFKAAFWSLESNTRQHHRVGEILEQLHSAEGMNESEQLAIAVILSKTMPEKYSFTRIDTDRWSFQNKANTAQPATTHRANTVLANDSAVQSSNDFTGALLATTDEDWRKKWNTPPETVPGFTKAGKVAYGKQVNILTFFANPQLDSEGKANVRCDLRIIAPDGKVAHEQKDLTCFAGAIEGSPLAMRLAAPTITFAGDDDDLPGNWTIEVLLRDTIRKVELSLKTSFELSRP